MPLKGGWVIRVLIVDDHAVVRAGLGGVLGDAEGIVVVGGCADGAEVPDVARRVRPAAESFNSTVEFELLRSNHFTTREQARRAVAAWIDEYNTVRRHSTNLMLSPVDYERRQDQARSRDAA